MSNIDFMGVLSHLSVSLKEKVVCSLEANDFLSHVILTSFYQKLKLTSYRPAINKGVTAFSTE